MTADDRVSTNPQLAVSPQKYRAPYFTIADSTFHPSLAFPPTYILPSPLFPMLSIRTPTSTRLVFAFSTRYFSTTTTTATTTTTTKRQMTKLKTRRIGADDVSAVGYGAMGLASHYGVVPGDEERLQVRAVSSFLFFFFVCLFV